MQNSFEHCKGTYNASNVPDRPDTLLSKFVIKQNFVYEFSASPTKSTKYRPHFFSVIKRSFLIHFVYKEPSH